LGVKASARGRHGGTVRPDAARLQVGPRQADSGPTSGRVGGESGVDDAGPPATDVTVNGARAIERRATERCGRDSLIAVRMLAAPDAPERVTARDEHEDEDEHLEAALGIRREDRRSDVGHCEADGAVEDHL
jgi:hypothetical protein